MITISVPLLFLQPALQFSLLPRQSIGWFTVIAQLMIVLVVFPFSVAVSSNSLGPEYDLVHAAIERTKHKIRYDGGYYLIKYPLGDVPDHIGVCTDVLIRSYRAIGIDLQRLVHEDMSDNFSAYPSTRIWGLKTTDRNIDHRRVPNLQVFFARHGQVLEISNNKKDYRAGDIVSWMTPGNLPHIGIVTDKIASNGNPLIAHNIGAGPMLEDMLFDFDISGHYRYLPVTLVAD